MTIAVPKDASPGEHYAVVWGEVSDRAPAAGGVTRVNRVGIRMYISIAPGGAPPPNFTIGALVAGRSANGQPIVSARITNSGGRILDVNGSLTLSKGPGGLRAGPFPVSVGAGLGPGASEAATVQLDERRRFSCCSHSPSSPCSVSRSLAGHVSREALAGEIGLDHDASVRGLSVRRLLLLATAAMFVGRLALSLLRTGPLVVADEVGYLTNARVFAGGLPGQLETAPFYRGGYSLLLTPIVRLSSDPETSYRLILALNAVLAAALVPLLYLLCVRCFRVPPRRAVWPAIAAAAYPSVTLFSQAALSENLLLPLSVVWLVCLGSLFDARNERARGGWAVACGAVAAALYAVHGRMIVVVVLTVAALVVAGWRRRLGLRSAAAGVLTTVLGLFAAGRLDHYLVTHNYGGHSPDEAGQRLSNLESVHGTLSVLRNAAGQSWYLLVATLGIGLWAALAIDRESLRRLTRAAQSTPKLVLGLLVIALAGLVALSALSFGDVERADMLIYGRYTEVLIPPLLVVALTQLPSARRPRLSVALGAIGAVTLLVAVLRHTVHPVRSPNRWNVGSLPFLTSTLGLASLVGAGIVAAAALAALVALSRRYPAALAPAVLLLFIPTTAYIERDPVLAGEHYVYGAGWVTPGSVDTHGQPVAYDADQPTGLYVNQWFMPKARFVLFSGSTEPPPAPYVISSRAWARAHPALRPRALWSDRHHDRTLFSVANR